MDMGRTVAEPARVLWDMFFPWMNTNLLAVSMVVMRWVTGDNQHSGRKDTF